MKTIPEVWFITGSSRGLGRVLAEAVVADGQRVVATARDARQLDALVREAPDRVLAVAADVTDAAQVKAAVEAAVSRFGRIDVVVNNAGYGLTGAVEETMDEEARRQFDTNVFGVLNVLRAVLPQLRAQRSGRIINLSSVGGFVGTPGFGIYNASKFALEGLSEALAHEVRPLGIHVTLVEPGPFRTEWAGPSLKGTGLRIDDYRDTSGKTREWAAASSGHQAGDPERAARAMLQVAREAQPPLRLPLGQAAVTRIRGKLEQVRRDVDTWEAVAVGADFPEAAGSTAMAAYLQMNGART